ncbi:DUF1444 domain-containing protein [Bacillus siamensis]|uniref:DUF1444 domain-containing protein n=1 Tax=Bacillus siamensis TaxID=659243 RepID=UPI002DB82713|nr:DUF1444 domain-containing protein [Bacillus siamensis]MEC3656646.1 DUF1444 domain-containing protein [Bacillus siamensis]
MKMTSRKLSDLLKQRLQHENRSFFFDREKDTLRVEDQTTKKGITLELPPIIAKWETKKEEAIDEIVYYVSEAMEAMGGSGQEMSGKEAGIYPVIRSTSFPDQTGDGIPLVYDDHTAETRIYYALDLGKTYRLIDSRMLEKENWTKERIRETASFNLRSLPSVVKKDTVAGNYFYFFRANDGYDASRILNDSILHEYKQAAEGELAISVPHQDVLILADIRNESGYDILGQMSMSFFASGTVPITALSFLYNEGRLEPVFIMAKSRPKKD